MTPDDLQTALNVGLGGSSAVMAFFLKMLWDAYKRLLDEDLRLSREVSTLQVLVAGEYVKRDQFDAKIDAVFKKLDKIQSIAEKAYIHSAPDGKSHSRDYDS